MHTIESEAWGPNTGGAVYQAPLEHFGGLRASRAQQIMLIIQITNTPLILPPQIISKYGSGIYLAERWHCMAAHLCLLLGSY